MHFKSFDNSNKCSVVIQIDGCQRNLACNGMILLLNCSRCRGMSNKQKRESVFDFHRSNADILITIETHSVINDERMWTAEWGGKAVFSHGTNLARGLVIFTTKNVFQRMSRIDSSLDGRTIIFDYQENGKMITICAVYAPNNDNESFQYFEAVQSKLKDRHEHKIIIGVL